MVTLEYATQGLWVKYVAGVNVVPYDSCTRVYSDGASLR